MHFCFARKGFYMTLVQHHLWNIRYIFFKDLMTTLNIYSHYDSPLLLLALWVSFLLLLLFISFPRYEQLMFHGFYSVFECNIFYCPGFLTFAIIFYLLQNLCWYLNVFTCGIALLLCFISFQDFPSFSCWIEQRINANTEMKK